MRDGSGRRRRMRGAWAARAGAAVTAAAVGLTGLAGCSRSSDSPVPVVTQQELDALREDVSALEERVAALENEPSGRTDSGSPATPTGGAAPNPRADAMGQLDSMVGDELTVRGAVAGRPTVTDVGGVFRLAGAAGETVPVVSATPLGDLRADALVEVVGTVVRIDRDTFEQDFGIAADAVLDAPTRWLSEHDGSIAVSADRVQVIDGGPDR